MYQKTVNRVTVKEVEEFTFTREELQQFVDTYFEVVIATAQQIVDLGVTKDQFYKDDVPGEKSLRDKYMANAAKHLRTMTGIETIPMGSSWGHIRSVKDVEKMTYDERFHPERFHFDEADCE